MTGAPRKAAIHILFFAEFSSCRATKFIIIRDNMSDDRVPNNETVYCSVSWYVIPFGPFGIPRLPWWDTSGPWKLVIGMFSSGQSSFRSLMHGSREDSGTKDVRAYYPFPFHASLRASLKWSMETTEMTDDAGAKGGAACSQLCPQANLSHASSHRTWWKPFHAVNSAWETPSFNRAIA